MRHSLKLAGLISLGFLSGALATVSLQTWASASFSPLPFDEVQKLASVYSLVKKSYVEPVEGSKLMEDAIRGMVGGLDPHSEYFDAKSYKEFQEGVSGRFVGVGIEIAQEEGFVKVLSPIEGTPADKAGLMAGDLIIEIDGKKTKGLSLTEAVKRMRGEPNTKVQLTVLRKAEGRTFPVEITRQEIKTVSVKAKLIEPHYAWLRITQFQERTIEDFSRKAQELYKQDPNIQGLVLDLRNDPGGLLHAAVAVSASFLPENSVIVSRQGQSLEKKILHRAAPHEWIRQVERSGGDPIEQLTKNTRGLFKKIPIVVLINEGSASASEIVAGALQDHERAKLMGSQTFGKGSVQGVMPLGDTGSAVKLTVERYYTPKERSIQAKGIVPDIWVDETAEGNLFADLRTREADLDKHLTNGPESEDLEKARKEALKKLEEERKKSPDKVLRLPEFGSAEDFQLQQALNQLKGLPVQSSPARTARSNAS